MKKGILLVFLTFVFVFCGCNVNELVIDSQASDTAAETPETAVLPGWTILESDKSTPKPTYSPGSNSETIDSLTERMKNNKEINSVEGLTCESTVIDAVDNIGADNINTAVISYNSELLGFPSVAKCLFSPSGEGTLSLKVMSFYVYPGDQEKGKKEQVQELVSKLDAELGSRRSEGTADYSWGSGTHYVFLNASLKDLLPPRAIAQVNALSNDSNITDIFPYKFGSDIHTVYQSSIPGSMPKDLTDPFLYYMYYYDMDTYINFDFKVQDSEIKLCKAEYGVHLLDTGFEDMEECFKSFGDSMEEILGPAASRDDSPSESLSFMENPPQKIYKPTLVMNWPGLEIYAYYDSGGTPYIHFYFSEEYFTAE